MSAVSLMSIINTFFKTDEAKATCKLMINIGSRCESIIEFGSRGGVSSLAMLEGLIEGRIGSTWTPRFTAVDLVEDESIVKLKEICEKIDVSFNFWKGHTADFPVFEADCFLWDSFHSAANLRVDLDRVAPWIHRYILILGTRIDGQQSESVRRGLDSATTAHELRVPVEDINKGLCYAIGEFLKRSPEWVKDGEIGELTVLKRINVNPEWLFSN